MNVVDALNVENQWNILMKIFVLDVMVISVLVNKICSVGPALVKFVVIVVESILFVNTMSRLVKLVWNQFVKDVV